MQNDPLKNLLPKDLDARQKEFLALVPAAGSIGNQALRQALKTRFVTGDWNADMYWAIQNSLVERGVLIKGRGYGGSVRRVAQLNDEVADDAVIAKNYKKESELYEPIATVLKNDWARDQMFDDCYVEITAQGGARPTNGRWTRPDRRACKSGGGNF